MLKKFFLEVKERKVIRWISIYFSFALTITGAENLFGSKYNFPDFIFDSMVVIIIAGIPSILIMAWFHGKEGPQKIKKKEIFLHAVVALIGILFLANILDFPNFNVKIIKDRSIAVLPFDNLSTLKEDEYFTEGVMEDILTQLAKINELRVISKTSVAKYRDSKKTIPEIAKELGVASILEGSVRRSGNRVRIVSQLIDTKADKNLWAETYDREIKDIFAIQSEVAIQIAQALKTRLTKDERDLIDKKSTENINAYTFYLKAREYYNLYTKESNEKAIELFNNAIELDHNYALAYAGIADAYAQRVQRFDYEENWLDSSIAMSRKALSIEPKLAEGYKSLGVVYALRGNFVEATEQYNKAVELNPNYAPALANLGSMYWWLGKYDKALYWMKKNISVNPLRPAGYKSIALVYLGLLDFEQAEKNFKSALELDPNFTETNADLTRMYITQGKYGKARQQIKNFLENYPDDNTTLTAAADIELFTGNLDKAKVYLDKIPPTAEYAYVLNKEGKKEESDQLFKEQLKSETDNIKNGSNEFTSYYNIARIYAVLGQQSEAIYWFKKAVQNGWCYYLWSVKDPLLENVSKTAEFKSVIEKLKSKINNYKQEIYKAESK